MRLSRTIAAAAIFALPGCMGVGLGGGINPLSLGIQAANSMASQSQGRAQASQITPAERARYVAMSCTELNQLVANYETAEEMAPNAPNANNTPTNREIAMTAIRTRLTYLRELKASRPC